MTDFRCRHCGRHYGPDEGDDDLFCSEQCRRDDQARYDDEYPNGQSIEDRMRAAAIDKLTEVFGGDRG